MVNLFVDEAATAAKWILPFAPLWSLAVLLRTGQDKWIQETYSRVRLAIIPPEAVNSIFALCSEALRQSVVRLSGGPEMVSNHLAERLVPTLRELLSRLSFRLDEKQRAVVFEFGLQLYRLGASRADQFVLEHTPALLERSAFAMTSSELFARIPALLNLPVLGEPGFEKVRLPEACPEPFDLYELRTKIRKATTPGGEWSPTIDRLIRLAGKGNSPITRKRAASRLGGLHKLALLTPSQQSDFARALWSELDQNIGLPANTDFYRFAFLALPETKPGEAKRLVRASLLRSEVPRVFSRGRLADGKEQKTYNPSITNNRFLHELNGSTKLKYLHEFSLKKRLREIARKHETVLAPLIGKPEEFAKAVSDLRNELTHPGEPGSGAEPDHHELLHLSEKMALMLEVCFLDEMGFAKERIAAIISNRSQRAYRLHRGWV